LPSDKKTYPEVEEARKKLSRMDIEGALAAFEAASKAHSELPSGRVMLGAILINGNRLREGRAQLEKAVIDTPTDPEPYLIFGDLAFNAGAYTDATLLFEKGLLLAQAFKGNDTKKADYLKRALTGVALGAEKQERWEDAQKNLQALIRVDSTLGLAHFRLGRVLFELKKPKEALSELQAAARLDEKVPSPEVTMAKFLASAKDREEADKWMERAIARAPTDPKTRLEVAQFYFETGRVAEAKSQAVEAVKLAPDSQEALYLAGVTSRFNKDYPEAVGYLEKAYLKAPGNMPISNQLALAQVEMGEEPARRALALAEGVMRQNQNNADAASTLGWIYFKLGRLDEAERMLQAAASTANVQPDTAYFYAKLADARNRGDAVKPLLNAALKSELPFAYREEAQKLSDQFGKQPAAPEATPTSSTPSAKSNPPSKTTAPAKTTAPPSKAPAAGKTATPAPPSKAPAPKQ